MILLITDTFYTSDLQWKEKDPGRGCTEEEDQRRLLERERDQAADEQLARKVKGL